MNTLTKQQMEAAIYAKAVDEDLSHDDPKNVVNDDVHNACGYPLADWREYDYESKDAMDKAIRRKRYDLWQMYETGKEVLESHTMRSTDSTTSLSAAQYDQSAESVKLSVVGTYLRKCGYVATAQAYDVVVFQSKS